MQMMATGMTLEDILKRLAAASEKIENGGGREVEDDEFDERDDGDESTCGDDMDLPNLLTKKATEGTDNIGPIKKKERRRYKGKRRTSMAGRTWVKLEDPKAPRRPRSGYVLFLSTNRGKYGTANQGANQSGINVALAGEWQKLAEEERKVYVDRANQERADYEREMEEYKKTPYYYAFALKKSLIMKQRKMFRQAGLPTDQSSEEAILKLTTDELETLQNVLKSVRRSGKGLQLPAGMDFSSTNSRDLLIPKVDKTDIQIFSDAFLKYNKDRESELRAVRRAIGIAESEQSGLKKSIAKLETDCENNQNIMSEVSVNDVEVTMKLWMQLAANAFQNVVLPNGDFINQSNVVSKVEDAVDMKMDDATVQAMKEVLKNVSFLTPPTI